MEAKTETLLKQVQSGKMETDTLKILDYAMKSKQFIIPDVEFKFCMKHETASARVAGLEKIGLVKKIDKHKSAKGTYSIYSYVSDPKEVAKCAHEQFIKRFDRWFKKAPEFAEFVDVTIKN